MAKTVSIGKQDFASLREQNCFYIDKTELIRAWWDSQDDITLITRPRRFGKTLNMDMLKCFFQSICRSELCLNRHSREEFIIMVSHLRVKKY